jgi:hypothetical protein
MAFRPGRLCGDQPDGLPGEQRRFPAKLKPLERTEHPHGKGA